MHTKFILASQSPRRKELLAQLGYQFDCLPAGIDESVLAGETPIAYVERIANAKAQFIANAFVNKSDERIVVLGSDTTVVSHGHILAKPKDLADCIEILTKLSGKMHQVLTAIAVTDGISIRNQVVVTNVYFKPLREQEIIAYWHTGEPQDKAGAYGIQGIGGQFVSRIEGSYSAVVGLPLYETAELLAQFGLPTAIQQVLQEL